MIKNQDSSIPSNTLRGRIWRLLKRILKIYIWLVLTSWVFLIWAIVFGHYGHHPMTLQENIIEGCIQNLPEYACPTFDPSGKADRMPPP
jgi:hypothetical protein